MFGIGGGELILIVFVVLMLFGSDKIPDIARTMGKAMAQLKNATNDIKSEIQKGAEANGLDSKSITDITGNINQEINNRVLKQLDKDTLIQILHKIQQRIETKSHWNKTEFVGLFTEILKNNIINKF